MNEENLIQVLTRIANSLDRIAPDRDSKNDLSTADAFVWNAKSKWLEPISNVNRIEIQLLKGIEQQLQILLDNTERFANNLPSNNALLWGARGTGKSSLIKAVHAKICEKIVNSPALVEIHREDIPTLPPLLSILRNYDRQFIVFCDDLSFDDHDASYKSLKAVLEGGIEGRPSNVIFYATSNRRHLMPRDMMENEGSTAINPSEAVEEKVSLSDRFGLWLGFHNCDQKTYLEMIDGYINFHNINIPKSEWQLQAIEWSVTRGARSGRVAWQFIQDLAGSLGKSLK